MSHALLNTVSGGRPGDVPNHPIREWHLSWLPLDTAPDVIMDIALDVDGRGEYTTLPKDFQAKEFSAGDIPVTSDGWYAFDSSDPRMIGYDYCTPDYIMGSLLIDPILPRVESRVGSDLEARYPALTCQNRYHAIVFPAISMPVWFPNAKAWVIERLMASSRLSSIRMFYWSSGMPNLRPREICVSFGVVKVCGPGSLRLMDG